QDFYIDAELYLDTRDAGNTDELSRTVDYGEVCSRMTEYMQKNTFRLLEAAAEHMAPDLLCSFPSLKGMELRILKPNAPIPYPFGNVSVSIRRMWHTAYIALGSNMGEKETYIREGIAALEGNSHCRVKKISGLITTKPYGGVVQEDFLNGVLELETLLSPHQLLDFIHEVETKAGRKRLVHWGPRTLDLDILFYDEEIIDTPQLTIPHADMANRDFVLEPLCEIAPYLRHPLTKQTVRDMLAALKK
ncbi:MAG: 2-amino-4-hydroxy-6-hydroxymethyldihydropteridine diphosphokinase, partial [Lachnospiraceae bacterium]|nr:2-amino-4-hydroxy-6-hydroxymethyldihydropteridine diphosphokinase [Lachnospiraceae bacterium]